MPSGGFVIAVSSCLLGLYGATAGPRMPTTMKVNTIRLPVKAFACNRGAKRPTRPGVFSVADSRVNDSIKCVNNQVDDNESRRVGDHDSCNKRIITGVQGRDQKATDATPRKVFFRESLGARSDNIFFVHHLQNRRASYPHPDAKHIYPQSQCRHADV